MDAYRVDVESILEVLAASIVVSDDIAIDSLEVGAETFKPRGPAHLDVTITNAGTAVVVMGRVTLPVLATCARCLCEFPSQIEAEVDGFFVVPGKEEGVPEEQEIQYIDAENRIDLLPSVLSALVLEAPFAPLHDEDCAGICPTCGADLNEGPCGCEPRSGVAHPFAGLGDLLEDPGER